MGWGYFRPRGLVANVAFQLFRLLHSSTLTLGLPKDLSGLYGVSLVNILVRRLAGFRCSHTETLIVSVEFHLGPRC